MKECTRTTDACKDDPVRLQQRLRRAVRFTNGPWKQSRSLKIDRVLVQLDASGAFAAASGGGA